MLRPQGFSPSRRLAPLVASRAYSIPVPLLGFLPSRPCSSPGAVRPLGRRAPRLARLDIKKRPAALGTPTPGKARRQAWVSARLLCRLPPWAFPLRGISPVAAETRSRAALGSPLALFRLGRTLTSPPAPQGFSCHGYCPSLSRLADLPAVLHLVVPPGKTEGPCR
jgi:hypothetical protein